MFYGSLFELSSAKGLEDAERRY